MGHGLDMKEIVTRSLAGKRNVSLLLIAQRGYGTYPAPWWKRNQISFPRIKQLGLKLTTHVRIVPKLRIIGALNQKITFLHGIHRDYIALNMTR
jgi:hypothetical protein